MAEASKATEASRFAVTLASLVASARVPVDEQVEERDVRQRGGEDEDAGHLPGNVRPYGA